MANKHKDNNKYGKITFTLNQEFFDLAREFLNLLNDIEEKDGKGSPFNINLEGIKTTDFCVEVPTKYETIIRLLRNVEEDFDYKNLDKSILSGTQSVLCCKCIVADLTPLEPSPKYILAFKDYQTLVVSRVMANLFLCRLWLKETEGVD